HLVGTLIELLQAQGVKAEIWMYPQYQEERITPWPELVQAVNERRIQAILMPDSTSADRSWINRLKIPSVEYTPDVIRNRITIEPGAAERLAVQELARMGCKSVGMISPYSQSWLDAHDDSYEWVQADRAFSDAVKKQGLVLHEPWISHPLTVPASDIWESDSERYGYEAMSRLLAMTQRPDGIFVQHDLVARGALSAVLRSKIAVPEELKLVLYRNAEIGLSCPVPAAFVDLSITEVAQAIINVLYARLRGEEVTVVKVSPKLTPLTDYKLQNNQTTLVKRGVSQLLNETV
ncbi:MAG: substrate-binding domain-containing protein, partial [Phycisphaerae bacterium]